MNHKLGESVIQLLINYKHSLIGVIIARLKGYDRITNGDLMERIKFPINKR